jgi:IS6 family transposase
VRKFGPEIRKRALRLYRIWRGLTWHLDETCIRVNGRWCYHWRAVDQFGPLIDFRLTARWDAKAARAFLHQERETVRLYQPLTIITDKAQTYAKVIAEINDRPGQEDPLRHLTRKHLNNRIKSDHAALKRLLRPMRGFRDLALAKATLKGIETFRAIRKAEFDGATKGVANEIAFTAKLFQDAT